MLQTFRDKKDKWARKIQESLAEEAKSQRMGLVEHDSGVKGCTLGGGLMNQITERSKTHRKQRHGQSPRFPWERWQVGEDR